MMSRTRSLLTAFLPPLVLALVLGIIFLLPRQEQLLESSIRPEMPLYGDLEGWYGMKIQETEIERSVLAADTRFSKACYVKRRNSLMAPREPQVVASIVYSGSDMNSSIHRPERCLPAQGHLDLIGHASDVTLSDGHVLTFTRLTSRTPAPEKEGKDLQHINYYIFVGHDSIQSNHLARTLRDMYDRVFRGCAQRWAYFQIGTCWGGSTGISEKQAETRLRELISQLTPKLMEWERIEN